MCNSNQSTGTTPNRSQRARSRSPRGREGVVPLLVPPPPRSNIRSNTIFTQAASDVGRMCRVADCKRPALENRNKCVFHFEEMFMDKNTACEKYNTRDAGTNDRFAFCIAAGCNLQRMAGFEYCGVVHGW